MSTRTNIVVKSKWGENLWFYRHSDGYPEGAMPTLQQFIGWIRRGVVRDNAEQAAGWLILIGAMEYQTLDPDNFKGEKYEVALETPKDWKCGAYEPACGVHSDIEFLYIIDLEAKTISCYESWDKEGKPEGEPLFVDTAENPWKLKTN